MTGLRIVLRLAIPVLLCVPAGAAAAAPAGAAADETALVQFYGGGTALTGAERAALHAAVRRTFAADPLGAQSAAADAAQVRAILKRQSGPNLAYARELGRTQVAFGGMHALGPGAEGSMARRIIEAHDPVVVSDPARQQLVTRQTVKALAQGVSEGARLFGAPAPGPEAALAEAVRNGWSGMDGGIRDAMVHAGRDMPFAMPFLMHARPAARAAFLARWRPQVIEAPSPIVQQVRIAEIMAFVAATGFKNRASLQGGPAAGADAFNNQAAIDRAGRALMPGCGVAAGSVMSPERSSFCQPAPIP